MKNFLFQNLNPSQVWKGWLTTFAVITVFILLPLGQLTRLNIPIGGAVYLHELPLLGVVALQLPLLIRWLQFQSRKSASILRPANIHFLKIGLLFLTWVILGIAVQLITSGDLVPLFYIARLAVYLAFLVIIKLIFVYKPLLLEIWLLVSGIWYWWLAFLQYLLLPDTRFLSILGWDDHYYRMIGTLFDPGLTGILLVLTLLCLYSLKNYFSRIPHYGTVVFGVGVVGLISSVLSTYSRASYLSLLTAILLLFVREYLAGKAGIFTQNYRRKMTYLVAGLIVVIAIYVSIPKPGGEGIRLLRTSTITARVQSATHSITELKTSQWVIGTGLFSQPATQQEVPSKATIPDNIFITLLTQTGTVGLVLALYLLFTVLKFLWKNDAIAVSAVAAVLVQSQFNNTALHPYIIFYLGILLITRYLRVTFRSTST
jgi:hypothetical protein